MAVIECKDCGAAVDDSWSACPACGATVGIGPTEAAAEPDAGVARCRACGRELVAGAWFCGECGEPVGGSSPVVERAHVAAGGTYATLHIRWTGRPTSLTDVALVGVRERSRTGVSWCGVYLDAKRVGRIVRGRGVRVKVTPGRRKLAVGLTGNMSSAVKINADPGAELFYECGYGEEWGAGVIELVADVVMDTPPVRGGGDDSRFWLRPAHEPPSGP
jgi:hypothetical protein